MWLDYSLQDPLPFTTLTFGRSTPAPFCQVGLVFVQQMIQMHLNFQYLDIACKLVLIPWLKPVTDLFAMTSMMPLSHEHD